VIQFSFKLLLGAASLGCSGTHEPHSQPQNRALLEQKPVGGKRREGGMAGKNCWELEKTRVGGWLHGMTWAPLPAARPDRPALWLTWRSNLRFFHIASTHQASPRPTCGAPSLRTAYGTSHLIRDITSRDHQQVFTQNLN